MSCLSSQIFMLRRQKNNIFSGVNWASECVAARPRASWWDTLGHHGRGLPPQRTTYHSCILWCRRSTFDGSISKEFKQSKCKLWSLTVNYSGYNLIEFSHIKPIIQLMIWLELCSLAQADTSHLSTWGCPSILWRPWIVAWRLGSSPEVKSIVNQSLIEEARGLSLPPSPVNNSKLAPQSAMAHHSNPNSPEDSTLNVNVSGTSDRASTRILRRNPKTRQQKRQFLHQETQLPRQVAPPSLNQKPRRASQNRNVNVSLRDQANMSALTVAAHVQSPVSYRNIFAPTQVKDPIHVPHVASLLRPRVTCTNTANRIRTRWRQGWH